MVDEESRKYAIKKKPTYQLGQRTAAQKRHFFLDGKLYKMVRQDRAANLLRAWDFTENAHKTFILSDAKKRMKNAYDTIEVARMLNRTRERIQYYINKGIIHRPQAIYAKGMNGSGHPFDVLKWSDDDILALHTYLLTSGGGRPRKDGLQYSAARIPSRSELLAILRHQPMFYMQTSEGEMVQVWSAYNEI